MMKMFGKLASRDRKFSYTLSDPRGESMLDRDRLDELCEADHSLVNQVRKGRRVRAWKD